MQTATAVALCFLLPIAGCDSRQDGSQPPEVDLPIADGAPAVTEAALTVVTVFRAERTTPSPKRAEAAADWRIRVGAGPAQSWRRDGRDDLEAAFLRLAVGAAEPGSFLLRADARTPNRVIQSLLSAANAALVGKLFVAVSGASGGPARAFPVHIGGRGAGFVATCGQGFVPLVDPNTGERIDWVPDDQDPIAPPVIVLGWNASTGRLDRLIGMHSVPDTTDGNALLERLLLDAHDKQLARGVDLPPMIDCGPEVAWQNVIDVVATAFRAGWHIVDFAFGGVEDPTHEVPR